MSIEFVQDPAAPHILIQPDGECDLQRSTRTMEAIAADPRFTPDARVLADCRGMGYTPTVQDAWALAWLISADRLFRRARVAVVADRLVQYGVANMVAAMSNARGATVRGFRDVEQARAWLLTDSVN